MESKSVLTKQQQIALNAKRLPEVSFTSLAYHMDEWWMYEAYKRTRKDGALGIDKNTAEEYGKELGNNLLDLKERAKSGKYRAPAVRRVYIPKGKGKEKRPIGIPTFEDKILQRAVQMLIEPVYEQDFYEFSYGFRPGRSAHMAVERLWKEIMDSNGCWIIDLDIRKFFDTMSHVHMRGILKQRVCDGVITRLIGKWLKAGVMESGKITYSNEGTPQGGVISAILSNIYLDEVLDKWYMKQVKSRMKKRSFIVRYADDAVMGFKIKDDALKVLRVLSKRFERFGLEIHPEKTKLIRFERPKGNNDKPGTFNFLGFTYYWGKSRKKKWIVKRKTEKSRIARSLRAIKIWCRINRHMKIREQNKQLSRKILGHYAYYGITNNFRSISIYWIIVKEIWRKWLDRRSRKRELTWEKFCKILNRYPLPKPRIVHSYCTAKL